MGASGSKQTAAVRVPAEPTAQLQHAGSVAMRGGVSPMPLLAGRLEPALLARLCACPAFATPSLPPDVATVADAADAVDDVAPAKEVLGALDQQLTPHGYFRTRDPGHPNGHVYYEGYLHGRPSAGSDGGTAARRGCEAGAHAADDASANGGAAAGADADAAPAASTVVCAAPGPVLSINPRYGSDMDKPAAPPLLRAFLAAFRDLNEAWLRATLADALAIAGLRLRGDGADAPPGTVGDVAIDVELDDLFADVAAQSHHGGASVPVSATGRPQDGWHVDVENSLLHMAVSLHGTRFLHLSDDDMTPQGRVEMSAGAVYLTSPSSFYHAVEYPECRLDTRILALQCRILVRGENIEHTALNMRRLSTPQHRDAVRECLAAALGRGAGMLRVPTLAEVEARMPSTTG